MATALLAIREISLRNEVDGWGRSLGLATWNLRTHGCWESPDSVATGIRLVKILRMTNW